MLKQMLSMKLNFRRILIPVSILLTGLILFFFLKEKNKSFLKIPMISLRDSPFLCLEALVENKKALLVIDTGSSKIVALNEDFLKEIKNKNNNGCSKYLDLNGNAYDLQEFTLKSMKIKGEGTGEINFMDVLVTEESDDFIKNAGKINKTPNELSKLTKEELEKKTGRIGIDVFRKHNYWLFDFPNQFLYFIKGVEETKETLGLLLDEFIEVPLETTSSHMVIQIETDFGIKKFVLDTACQVTILRVPTSEYSNSQYIKTKKFIANGKDFGVTELFLFDLPPVFNTFDGLLGIDFLKSRAVLFDFENNRIFIGPKAKTIKKDIKNNRSEIKND